MNLATVYARIIIRYGVGALIAYGLLSQDTGETILGDPDIVIVASSMIGAAVEGFYLWVRKNGGAT